MAGDFCRTLGDRIGQIIGQLFHQVVAGKRYLMEIRSSQDHQLLDRMYSEQGWWQKPSDGGGGNVGKCGGKYGGNSGLADVG